MNDAVVTPFDLDTHARALLAELNDAYATDNDGGPVTNAQLQVVMMSLVHDQLLEDFDRMFDAAAIGYILAMREVSKWVNMSECKYNFMDWC